jgi:hypothetical protein
VYSIYKELDMGNPGEMPKKDFFINMGSSNGLHAGSSVEVYRKTSTYDTLSEKLYRDIVFPIARLKVIHVESNAAVARIEKFLPTDKTPILNPPGIMVGDLIRPAEGR